MQATGAASQNLENVRAAPLLPPLPDQLRSSPENGSSPENVISNVSIFIHQTLFAGNVECVTATPLHEHPRGYFAVLVAQSDKIIGLFLYDAIKSANCDGISLKLEQAVDAIAVDSSTDDFVTFGDQDNSFSLVSIDDSGQMQTYKFICNNASALTSWRRHLLPHKQFPDTSDSGSSRSSAQNMSEQLARCSEVLRTTTQKLSSMEVAYK
jgi:hypothetical protein